MCDHRVIYNQKKIFFLTFKGKGKGCGWLPCKIFTELKECISQVRNSRQFTYLNVKVKISGRGALIKGTALLNSSKFVVSLHLLVVAL